MAEMLPWLRACPPAPGCDSEASQRQAEVVLVFRLPVDVGALLQELMRRGGRMLGQAPGSPATGGIRRRNTWAMITGQGQTCL